MIFDKTLLFSNAQAITASAKSTNLLDFGPIATGLQRDVGKGKKVPLLIQVVEAFDSAADDETLTVSLQLDSTETVTPDKSIVLGTISNANLKIVGAQIPFDVLPNGVNLRYGQLYYTVAGTGNFTAGKITAGIVAAVQTNN